MSEALCEPNAECNRWPFCDCRSIRIRSLAAEANTIGGIVIHILPQHIIGISGYYEIPNCIGTGTGDCPEQWRIAPPSGEAWAPKWWRTPEIQMRMRRHEMGVPDA